MASELHALHCLTSTLNMTSFNLVIHHPPLDPAIAAEAWRDFPVVVRMVDRGDPMSRTACFNAEVGARNGEFGGE